MRRSCHAKLVGHCPHFIDYKTKSRTRPSDVIIMYIAHKLRSTAPRNTTKHSSFTRKKQIKKAKS
ncbi:hypothetical protein YC2023_021615 [Brassica napus]